MKNTGTLRIQTFAARQSAPVEGVTVAVQGDGFTLHCITDATGSAADIPVEAPACTLSLDEDNTTRPYAIVSLTAAKPGYRTVRIEGIQIFAGQVTLAQPQMLPDTEEGKDIPNAPIVIPPHALFAGSGGSGRSRGKTARPGYWIRSSFPKISRCIWQTGSFRPQRDDLLPGLYRKCCFQRGVSHLAGAGTAGEYPLPDLAGAEPHLYRVVPQQGLHLQHYQLHQLRPVLRPRAHGVRGDGAHHG